MAVEKAELKNVADESKDTYKPENKDDSAPGTDEDNPETENTINFGYGVEAGEIIADDSMDTHVSERKDDFTPGLDEDNPDIENTTAVGTTALGTTAGGNTTLEEIIADGSMDTHMTERKDDPEGDYKDNKVQHPEGITPDVEIYPEGEHKDKDVLKDAQMEEMDQDDLDWSQDDFGFLKEWKDDQCFCVNGLAEKCKQWIYGEWLKNAENAEN